jgi:hypothetical protein
MCCKGKNEAFLIIIYQIDYVIIKSIVEKKLKKIEKNLEK